MEGANLSALSTSHGQGVLPIDSKKQKLIIHESCTFPYDGELELGVELGLAMGGANDQGRPNK